MRPGPTALQKDPLEQYQSAYPSELSHKYTNLRVNEVSSNGWLSKDGKWEFIYRLIKAEHNGITETTKSISKKTSLVPHHTSILLL